MLKIIFIIILSIIILNIGSSNIINSHSITIFVGNYEIITQKGFLFLVVALVVILLILAIYLSIGLVFFTKHKKVISNNNKSSIALDNMIDCITLTNLGDYNGSQKALKQISKNLSGHPIVNLLNIQSNNIVNNKKEINKNFEALLNNKKTRNFALQGLAILAKKNSDLEKAEHYLEESYQEIPYAKNTILALLETYKSLQSWQKLITLINDNYKKKTIDKGSYNHDLAICYLMLYLENKKDNYIIKARKLYPNNHKIEIEYANYLLAANKKSALTKHIKSIWKHNNHPQIIEIYLQNISSKNITAKIKHLETLININPKGDKAVIELARMVIEHKIRVNNCTKILNNSLKFSNSYDLYQISLEFFKSFPSDENDVTYGHLLQQEENYYFRPHYYCNECNNISDSWSILCQNCGAYDNIEYNNISGEKIVLTE